MFERTPDLDVVYVPWRGVDPDDAVRIGAAWLQQQPGAPLVLLHAKKMYGNNELLPRLTAGAAVEKPATVWRSGWRGGPVLAPWPSEVVLAALSDTLAQRTTAVCVIEWGDFDYQEAWLAAHGAVDLVTGQVRGARRQLLDPVIEVAMRRLSTRSITTTGSCRLTTRPTRYGPSRNWSAAATATRLTHSALGPWRTGLPSARSSICATMRLGRSKAARFGCA
jgi:hypothetical protein